MEIISIRIPKTGSHTLAEYFYYTYGTQEPIYPDIIPSNEGASPYYQDREVAKEIIKEYSTRIEGNQFIHMHIPVWAWDGLFPGVPRICFMRHPVPWLVSNYFFALALGALPNTTTIYDYMSISYRQNWQSWFMNGSIKNFDFIGFQETFDDDVIELYNYIGKPLPPKPEPQNVSLYPNYLRVKNDLLRDKQFIRQVKRVFKQDFALYREAWSKWKKTPPPL